MYKLVIIDDEPLVLQGIRNIIDWESFGFSNVRTFSNPVQALSSILEEPPDVILSDIRMPVMSGLAILERCREARIQTLFVLVSAYSEFDYAKQAIENGAFTYVLKPLARDSMEELAESLCNRLAIQRQQQAEITVRNAVLQTLTGISFREEPSMAYALGMVTPYRVCFTASRPQLSGQWVDIYDDLTVGFIPNGAEAAAQHLPLGLSSVVEQNVTHKHIREALVAYYTLRFYGNSTGQLIYAPTKLNTVSIDQIGKLIAQQDSQQACFQLRQLQQQVRQQLLPIDHLMHLYNRLISLIMAYCGEHSFGEDFRFFDNCLSMCGIFGNVDTMFASLEALVEGICNHPAEEDRVSRTAIRDAILYIDEKFTEPLTLELLAKRFHISSSYLSRQFKQLTGSTFSEYLKSKRIAYACQMLRSSRMSVSDVGTSCGYEDYFYFNKTFKKATGLTPSKYRETVQFGTNTPAGAG